jgi:membrane protein implicated in regulation of membrane protease activity
MNRNVLSSESYHRLHMIAGVFYISSILMAAYLVIFKLVPAIVFGVGTVPGSIHYEGMLYFAFVLAAMASFVSYVLMTMAMQASNRRRIEELNGTTANVARPANKTVVCE